MTAYGNACTFVQNQMSDLDTIGGLGKLRGDEKWLDGIASLLIKMTYLSQLAREHKIEDQLYEGGGLERVFSCLANYIT